MRHLYAGFALIYTHVRNDLHEEGSGNGVHVGLHALIFLFHPIPTLARLASSNVTLKLQGIFIKIRYLGK